MLDALEASLRGHVALVCMQAGRLTTAYDVHMYQLALENTANAKEIKGQVSFLSGIIPDRIPKKTLWYLLVTGDIIQILIIIISE